MDVLQLGLERVLVLLGLLERDALALEEVVGVHVLHVLFLEVLVQRLRTSTGGGEKKEAEWAGLVMPTGLIPDPPLQDRVPYLPECVRVVGREGERGLVEALVLHVLERGHGGQRVQRPEAVPRPHPALQVDEPRLHNTTGDRPQANTTQTHIHISMHATWARGHLQASSRLSPFSSLWPRVAHLVVDELHVGGGGGHAHEDVLRLPLQALRLEVRPPDTYMPTHTSAEEAEAQSACQVDVGITQ